jgi:hypothetical protein
MRDEARWRFAIAMSRAHRLRETTLRLVADTRELVHRSRNTRHVARLTREVFQRRMAAATGPLSGNSLPTEASELSISRRSCR